MMTTIDNTTITITLIVLATAFNGILAGASLDQSIKQLPTRHKIGLKVFSAYSKESDLSRRGIIWYATIGIGGALLTIVAAVNISFNYNESSIISIIPIYFAAVFATLHSFVTTQAAPVNFKQRKIVNDNEHQLINIFNNFERLSRIRTVFQVLSFAGTLLSLLLLAL